MKTLLEEAATVRNHLRPAETGADFDTLLDMADNARHVLLGEASHGTHDFYALRAELTRRLIMEKGLRAVALEAGGRSHRRSGPALVGLTVVF